MGFIVRDNIDIVDETCNALFFIVNEEKRLKSFEEKINKLGLDNEKYMKKEMKSLFKFLEKFKGRNKVPMKILNRYFAEINDAKTSCISTLFLKNMKEEELSLNKEKIIEMEEVKLKELVMKEILSGLDFIPEDFSQEDEFINIDVEKEFMPFLINKCDLLGEIKWYLTMIAQEPKTYLVELFDIVIEAIDIFKEIFTVIEKDVEKAIEELRQEIGANPQYISDVTGIRILEQWDRDLNVQPSMINFNAVSIQCSQSFIFGTPRRDDLYFGWKFNELMKISYGKDKEEEILNERLKCLSDKSKFKILKHLKEKPMFGQEIATALALTTATVSHHMNALLNSKLVNLERIENKIYYTLNNETIEKTIKSIEKELK